MKDSDVFGVSFLTFVGYYFLRLGVSFIMVGSQRFLRLGVSVLTFEV